MGLIELTEDGKVKISNSSGMIVFAPDEVNGVIDCIKNVMQVSEFSCEKNDRLEKRIDLLFDLVATSTAALAVQNQGNILIATGAVKDSESCIQPLTELTSTIKELKEEYKGLSK